MVQPSWLSHIWVPLLPAASTVSPKFYPNEIKVLYLKCTNGNLVPCLPWPPRLDCWVFFRKSLVMMSRGNKCLEGSEDYMKQITQNRRAQAEWCLLPQPYRQSPPGTSQRQKEKPIKHHGSSGLMRSSTLLDRCSTDLYSQRALRKHDRELGAV